MQQLNRVYVGETRRHLLVRQYENMGRSILNEKPSKYNDKDATAIRKHCHQNNHQAGSSCFTLIGSASNNFHLKLKESLLILQLKLSLNVAKESMPLYLFDNDAQTSEYAIYVAIVIKLMKHFLCYILICLI